MTKLSDLLDVGDLQHEIRQGFVRLRWHPHAPLAIFNYTEKAQYEKHWNDITRQTRGLIVDTETNEVLARPFDKFFNLGEHDPSEFHEVAAVQVTDKMDGSLGILYPTPRKWNGDHRWAIATRGSFESEQAMHATSILWKKYPDFVPVNGYTYLFEIVYPENRIVLDYHDTDDLFLLGIRGIGSGKIGGPHVPCAWSGPTTQILHHNAPFAAAIKQADRENREGIVVRFWHDDRMLKVKQEDYVLLHKLVTGLNERAVWEHLSTHNGTYGELLADVPDEFHQWVTVHAEGFLDDFETLQGWAHFTYDNIIKVMGPDDDFDIDKNQWSRDYRKAFAGFAREAQHPALLFQMLDGRDIAPAIWKNLKPRGETASLMNRNEDNA